MSNNIIAKYEKVPYHEFVDSLSDTTDYAIINSGVENTYESIVLPRCSSAGSAGHDFRCPFDVELLPGNKYIIPTGIRCQMSNNFVLMLYPRSGLGTKYGLRLVNTVGVIDSSYYYADNFGHIKAVIEVDTPLVLHRGDRFIQGVFTPIGFAVDAITEEKRTGGFGSSGF